MNIEQKKIELERRRGRQLQVKEQIEAITQKVNALSRTIRLTEQAQTIMQEVARLTQEELKYQISDIVTLALASVFNDPYTFEVEFVTRRGKTEADLWFVRRGTKIHPLDASGGGAVDVACFALRVALWKLSQPHTRPVLILDEPFKHLSIDLQGRAADMVKALSQELGLQIIEISHVQDAIESADKVFETTFRNGVTRIV